MDTAKFSYRERAIFPKVKEIKRLHGGVDVYAPHASVRIDAEIGKKGRFRMKTNLQPLQQQAQASASTTNSNRLQCGQHWICGSRNKLLNSCGGRCMWQPVQVPSRASTTATPPRRSISRA